MTTLRRRRRSCSSRSGAHLRPGVHTEEDHEGIPQGSDPRTRRHGGRRRQRRRAVIRGTRSTWAPPPARSRALMIGWPDADGIDPTTGEPTVGIGKLETAVRGQAPRHRPQDHQHPVGCRLHRLRPEDRVDDPGERGLRLPHAGRTRLRQAAAAPGPRCPDRRRTRRSRTCGRATSWRTAKAWTPDNPTATIFLPAYTGDRVIHWDAKLFEDWGVEPLERAPTLDEIDEQGRRHDRHQPGHRRAELRLLVPGQVHQLAVPDHRARHGRELGPGQRRRHPGPSTGTRPNTSPALERLVEIAKYAPAGALAADAMPQGFLTDQNVVAIIPEGEPGYFIQELINGTDRAAGALPHRRTTCAAPMAWAAWPRSTRSPWRRAAPTRRPPGRSSSGWPASAETSSSYYFTEGGNLPTINGGAELIPALSVPARRGDHRHRAAASRSARYPWAVVRPALVAAGRARGRPRRHHDPRARPWPRPRPKPTTGWPSSSTNCTS